MRGGAWRCAEARGLTVSVFLLQVPGIPKLLHPEEWGGPACTCCLAVAMEGVLEAATALCTCKLAFSLLALPRLPPPRSPISFCCCCLLLFTDVALTGEFGRQERAFAASLFFGLRSLKASWTRVFGSVPRLPLRLQVLADGAGPAGG